MFLPVDLRESRRERREEEQFVVSEVFLSSKERERERGVEEF